MFSFTGQEKEKSEHGRRIINVQERMGRKGENSKVDVRVKKNYAGLQKLDGNVQT